MTESTFQTRTNEWYEACFSQGSQISEVERAHRFLEEALELVQANGSSKEDALALVDYVFDRPSGDPENEVGGVMVTLAVLCQVTGLDMMSSAEKELSRNWRRIDAIRHKHAAKQDAGPLP